MGARPNEVDAISSVGPTALSLTPNGVTCCSYGESPWVRRQLYKSPEGAICVLNAGTNLEKSHAAPASDVAEAQTRPFNYALSPASAL